MRIEERIDCEVHAACFKSRTPNRNEDFFPLIYPIVVDIKQLKMRNFLTKKKTRKFHF